MSSPWALAHFGNVDRVALWSWMLHAEFLDMILLLGGQAYLPKLVSSVSNTNGKFSAKNREIFPKPRIFFNAIHRVECANERLTRIYPQWKTFN